MLNNSILSVISLSHLMFILFVFFLFVLSISNSEQYLNSIYYFYRHILMFFTSLAYTLTSSSTSTLPFLSFIIYCVFLLLVRNTVIVLFILIACLLFTFFDSFSVSSTIQLIILFEIVSILSVLAPYIIWSRGKYRSESLVFFLNILKWNSLSTTIGILSVYLSFIIFKSSSLIVLEVFTDQHTFFYPLFVFYLLSKMSSWFIIFFKYKFYKKSNFHLIAFFNFCYFWLAQTLVTPLIVSITSCNLLFTICILTMHLFFAVSFSSKVKSLHSFVLFTSLLTYISFLPLLLLN